MFQAVASEHRKLSGRVHQYSEACVCADHGMVLQRYEYRCCGLQGCQQKLKAVAGTRNREVAPLSRLQENKVMVVDGKKRMIKNEFLRRNPKLMYYISSAKEYIL